MHTELIPNAHRAHQVYRKLIMCTQSSTWLVHVGGPSSVQTSLRAHRAPSMHTEVKYTQLLTKCTQSSPSVHEAHQAGITVVHSLSLLYVPAATHNDPSVSLYGLVSHTSGHRTRRELRTRKQTDSSKLQGPKTPFLYLHHAFVTALTHNQEGHTQQCILGSGDNPNYLF